METNNLYLDATEIIFLYYQDMLERNQQTFDNVKVLETVTLLKKAKVIYLAGLGISSLAVKELATRLFSFGFTCSLLMENESNIITRASLIQPDDLLICISLEGKTMAVIAAAKEAKNNGVNNIPILIKLLFGFIKIYRYYAYYYFFNFVWKKWNFYFCFITVNILKW
ncbi:SIS domain-containing protein [Spiroplasma citri]|uniref:MurR/RpiR family transcriptional regulator n=1 Tax=Spiroplasma citri TaxID=2133 RepID=UPI00241278CA|nr:SIS domain-containing protein [Spiroplasma citri]WFH00679.1 SIS domain-containing protein [Spiroplasma citri]